VFQLEHCAECSNRNIGAVLRFLCLKIPDGIVLNVPTGTFHFAEKSWRKWLILRAGFWASQWIQGDRLWKKCLLSRTSDVY